jgi:hypothetical protein
MSRPNRAAFCWTRSDRTVPPASRETVGEKGRHRGSSRRQSLNPQALLVCFWNGQSSRRADDLHCAIRFETGAYKHR